MAANLSNDYDYSGTKGFKEGSYTQQSANKLEKTWNDAGGRFQNAFSVEYTSTDTLGRDAAELVYDPAAADSAYQNALTTTVAAGAAYEGFSNWEGDQYLQAVDAAHAATLDYLNDKLDKIIQYFTATSEVTVGTILGEVAPYAMNPKSAWSALGSRLADLKEKSNFTEMVGDLPKDALANILSNETLINSIANINAVQGLVASATAINNVWNTAEGILKSIEPILPPIEILAAMSGIWINPALASEASQKSLTYGQMLLDWAMSKATALLKKYVYSIKLTIPSFLLDTMNSLSVKSAVTEWSWGESGSASRYFAALATNSNDRTYDDGWSKVADKWVSDNAWNPNNYTSAEMLNRLGVSSEEYANILGKSLDHVIKASQSVLNIDTISSAAYSNYTSGNISFSGSFSYAWDNGRDPTGIRQTVNYANANTADDFVRNATDFFSQPDRRLILSGKTRSSANQLRTVTGGEIA